MVLFWEPMTTASRWRACQSSSRGCGLGGRGVGRVGWCHAGTQTARLALIIQAAEGSSHQSDPPTLRAPVSDPTHTNRTTPLLAICSRLSML